MKSVNVVILLGAPGAGKGTQAVRLSAECSLPHVSTGDLFRANLAQETEIGRKAKGYMDAGQLVPDEVVLEMLFDRVAAEDCRQGYLLDGFPRTEAQATALDARLAEADVRVYDIEVGDETIVERAAGRLLCRACGNIQHLRFKAPAVEGVCDACGGDLYQRDDDRPEVVRERLAVYHSQTEPLVAYYRAKGVLRSIDGERTPDQVFEELRSDCAGKS